MAVADRRLIDYWCNGFTPDRLVEWEKGLTDSPLRVSEELAAAFAEPDEFVARMDEAGVEAVLVPATHERRPSERIPFSDVEPPVLDVSDLSRRYPGRVYGLFSIDPDDAMKGVRDLEWSVTEHGFVGAHLHTHSWDRPLDHRDYYPYYAKCEELGVPVVLQVGHSAALAPSEGGRPFTADRPAIYFKRLRFVLSHTGWPWVDEAIAMAWKHPNVFLGTATHQPRFWPEELVRFAGGRGHDKVLLGTGFPVLRHGPLLDQVDALGLKPEARDALLHGNAARVFDLEGTD